MCPKVQSGNEEFAQKYDKTFADFLGNVKKCEEYAVK